MTAPTSAAGLVAELLGLGLSKRQIGKSVVVDDSYIGRILSGARGTTGDKYAGRLAELWDQVRAREAAGTPVRRGEVLPTTAPVEKRAQRLRRPARHYESRRASAAKAGKQASQNGARTLVGEVQHAAAEGRYIVVEMTTTSEALWRKYRKSGSAAQGPKKKGRTSYYTIEVGPMPAEDLLPYVEDAGGSLTAAAFAWAVDAGRMESDATDDELHTVVSVEVRTWDE